MLLVNPENNLRHSSFKLPSKTFQKAFWSKHKMRVWVRNLVTFASMIRQVFLFILFLAGSFSLQAQTAADTLQKGVDADPRLHTLVEKHTQVNDQGKAKGYRVQIYFGADKAKANELKSKFLAEYSSGVHAYEVYDVPNFKIRVGDFRTRMEAYRFLKKIRNDFPQSFIVESDIEYPEEN